MTDDTGTLADVLALASATLDPALADTRGQAILADCCGRLPIQAAAFWGLECPLGDSPARADLLIEIKRDSSAHARLAGAIPSAFDHLCEQSAAWTALRRFARAWAAEHEPRRQAIRNVWIEFDLIAASESTPAVDALLQPSVFWGPDAVGRGQWDAFADLTGFAAAAFDPFPAELPRAALRAAIDGLPDGARVFQLGAMQSRGDVVLRLCVNRVAAAAVPAWLARHRWPGDVDALRAALDTIAPMTRLVAIDLDYTHAGLGAKIGIECYQDWRNLSAEPWTPLLEHLAARGLCTGDKRRALTVFPASTELPLAEQAARKSDGMLFPVVYRNLHHVKVSFTGDRVVDAKAYLGVTRPGVRFGLATVNDGPDAADGWIGS